MTQIRWWPAAVTVLLALGLSTTNAQESCPASPKSAKTPKCCCEKESGCCSKCDAACPAENKSDKGEGGCCSERMIKFRMRLHGGVEDYDIAECDACEHAMCQGAEAWWTPPSVPFQFKIEMLTRQENWPQAPEATHKVIAIPVSCGGPDEDEIGFYKRITEADSAARQREALRAKMLEALPAKMLTVPPPIDFVTPVPPMPPGMNLVWHGEMNFKYEPQIVSQQFKKHSKAGGAHGGAEKVCPCEQCLHQKISVNFDGMPLRQVIDDLRKMTGANLLADEPAFRDAGVCLEQAVTLKLDNVTFKSVLNLLTHQLRMSWTCRDEVLMLTAPEQCRGKHIAKTYAVEDLVQPIKAKGAKGGARLEDVLIKLITHTVAPHTWSCMGGFGTIEYYPLGMTLVVNQTPEVHEQIAVLLQTLRQFRGPYAVALPPMKIAPAPVPMPPAMVYVVPPPPVTAPKVFSNVKESPTGSIFGLSVNSDAGLVGSVVVNERNFDCLPSPVPSHPLAEQKPSCCVPQACSTPTCCIATKPQKKVEGPDFILRAPGVEDSRPRTPQKKVEGPDFILRVVHRDEHKPLAESKAEWLVLVGKSNCIQAKDGSIRICKADKPLELRTRTFTAYADCLHWSPKEGFLVLEGNVTLEYERGWYKGGIHCDRVVIDPKDESVKSESVAK